MSPAVLFLVPVDLVESDLFNVLGAAAGCGVDRPDVLSSDALRVESSFLSWAATGGFAVGLIAGLAGAAAAAAGGGAYFAVLRYGGLS